MAVRAKFQVTEIARQRWTTWKDSIPQPTEVQHIKMSPVTGGTEENKAFWEATPCGSIDLGTISVEAGNQFELGKAYYVDFTPASD